MGKRKNKDRKRRANATAAALRAPAATPTPTPAPSEASSRALHMDHALERKFRARHLGERSASANAADGHYDGTTLNPTEWIVIGLTTIVMMGGAVIQTPPHTTYRAELGHANEARTPTDLYVPPVRPPTPRRAGRPRPCSRPSSGSGSPFASCCPSQLTRPRPSARFWHRGVAPLDEPVDRPRFMQFAWLQRRANTITRGQFLAWWCMTMLVFCAGVTVTRGKGKPSSTTMVMGGLHVAGGLLYKTYSNVRGNPPVKLVQDLERAESVALQMHARVRKCFGLPVCVTEKRAAPPCSARVEKRLTPPPPSPAPAPTAS